MWVIPTEEEALPDPVSQEPRQALVLHVAHEYPTNDTVLMGRKKRVRIGKFSLGETVLQGVPPIRV
eukprot:6168190-Karenia_brevis.AAC.1